MKKSPIRRPLQHLIRAEKHIAARVYLSNMIEQLLDNHDDQLDYTYKHAREEGFKVARKNYEDELEKQKLELEKLTISTYWNKPKSIRNVLMS